MNARAISRLATFAHAISNTSPTMHIKTIRPVEKSLRSGEYPVAAPVTSNFPFMNWSREYAVQSFAAGSVISYCRTCVNSSCTGAAAVSTVYPGFSRANTCTQRARRSSARIQVHSGSIARFISTGTRICGDSVGSRPRNWADDTPTMFIG